MDSQRKLTKVELLILGGVPLVLGVLLVLLALRRDAPTTTGDSPVNLYERVTAREKDAPQSSAAQTSAGGTKPSQTSASTGTP